MLVWVLTNRVLLGARLNRRKRQAVAIFNTFVGMWK